MRTKINKSEAIREAHAANPKATASELIQSLAEQKVVVTPQLVYNVLGRQGKPRRRTKGFGKSGLSIAQLEAAAEFAREAGGLKNAQAALDFLSRLR